MSQQVSPITLSLALRIASIFVGGLLVLWEAQNTSYNSPTSEESQNDWEKQGPYSSMKSRWAIDKNPPVNMLFNFFGIFRIVFLLLRPELWICIGLVLIGIGIFSTNGYTIVSPFLLAAAVIKIALFRLMEFAPNKHKFLVGNQTFKLIGEKGILTKNVTPTETGAIQMENPIFKNDIMDCIADASINAGEEAKVLEVDCGLLKVARIEK